MPHLAVQTAFKQLIGGNTLCEGGAYEGRAWRTVAKFFTCGFAMPAWKFRGKLPLTSHKNVTTIAELLPCDSSCANRNWKPEQPRPLPSRFFYGRSLPTSDFRIAAARTSSCTAFPRSFVRNGSSTTASSRWQPVLATH